MIAAIVIASVLGYLGVAGASSAVFYAYTRLDREDSRVAATFWPLAYAVWALVACVRYPERLAAHGIERLRERQAAKQLPEARVHR